MNKRMCIAAIMMGATVLMMMSGRVMMMRDGVGVVVSSAAMTVGNAVTMVDDVATMMGDVAMTVGPSLLQCRSSWSTWYNLLSRAVAWWTPYRAILTPYEGGKSRETGFIETSKWSSK